MQQTQHDFLAGGGEMGERMRSFDWSATPVGPIAGWPQSLKTAVQIVLGSRYPMFVWWGPGLTKFYNDAYIPVLGKRHPNALGQPAADVWSEIWPTLAPQTEVVLNEGRATWNEQLLLIMERNQFLEETYFTFSYSPAPDDDGSVGGIFCACTEDTARVLSERRLQTLRELAARTNDETRSVEDACRTAAEILANNPYDLPFAALYVLDADGRQARLVDSTGVSQNLSTTPAVVDLRQQDDPWSFRRVAESGGSVEVQNLSDKFGDLRVGAWPEPPQQAIVLPLAKSGQTELAGFLVAGLSPRLQLDDPYRGFLDLAAGQIATAVANARAYEEEKRRAEALAELDRSKTTFFSNVSHEFRTPLTLMLGPIEDLLTRGFTELSPATKGQLEVVNRNGLRLLRLVNSLLDFSRIEAGRVKAAYQPTDLPAFTADLASVFRAACERAGLRLVVDCQPLPEPVYVDRDLWEKIVLNLLSNAFKFTFAGQISVTLRQVQQTVELQVQDTGTGVPSDEIPRLFERFHRIENARGRTHEGSGIGLALVQELVRLHGGSITAESVVDQGTTFTVRLPTGTSHLPADQIGAGRSSASSASAASSYVEEALRWLPDEQPEQKQSELPTYTQRQAVTAVTSEATRSDQRPRVLVADDNADMRNYVRNLLAESYSVVAVPDGEAALAAAGRQPPDLILTDVMMPRLDGFGLLQQLRADPELRGIPVIMLSARAGEESRVEGMEAGADDYLVKPFSSRELLARVGAHLQMAQLRRDSELTVRESEERLRMALQAARMVAWQLDPATGSVHVSANAATVFGLPPGTTLETSEQGFALLHPDDADRHRAEIERAVQECGSYLSQFRMIRPDTGETIWLEDRGHGIAGESGETQRLAGVVMDITERKRAEAQLRQSEQHLRAIVETTPECIKIVAADGTVLQMNPAGLKMVDAEQESAVTGKRVFDVIAPEHREAFQAFHEKICAGERGILEFDTLGRRGTRRHMESHAVPLELADGQTVQLALTRDISDRKRAELALRQERDLLQVTLASIGDAVLTTDASGRVTHLNRVAERLTGWTSAQATGQPLEDVFQVVHEESGQPIENPAVRALREGVIVGLANHALLIRKDGQRTPIDDSAAPIRGPHDEVVGCVLVFRDVTERRRAESLLRQSEAHFRNMADNAPAVLWVTDPDGSCTFLSRSWYEFTGQTAAEGLGHGWLSATHPDDRERCRRLFEDANAKQQPFSFDYRLMSASGQYRWSIDSGCPRFDEDGTFQGYVGSVIDVHERKLGEDFRSGQALILEMITTEQPIDAILRELVYFVERQIPGAVGSVLLLDSEEKCLLHGAAPGLSDDYNAAIHGVKIGPAVGSCGTAAYRGERVVVQDIQTDPLWENFKQLAESHNLRACWSEPIWSSTGELLGTFAMYFSEPRDPVTDELDTLEATARFAGIAIERPRSQAALRDSEDQLRNALDAAGMGRWRANLRTQQGTRDGKLNQILGLSDEEITQSLDDYFRQVHPDDKPTALAAWQDAIQNRGRYDIEFRILRNDGSTGWLREIGRFVPGHDGGPDLMTGLTQDITYRKHAEVALRRNADTFATLVQQSPLGIYTVDSQFRIAHVSQGAMSAFRNVKHLIGRDFTEVMQILWPEPVASEVIEIFRHTLETGEPYVSPGLTEKRKDIGAIESYEWQVNRVTLGDGQFGVVCYFFDSTRLQSANRALRDSEQRFRALTNATSDIVYRMNADWTEMRQLDGREYIVDTVEPRQTWLETYIPAEDQPQVIPQIQQAIESQSVFELEHRILHKDGSSGWVYSRAIPILDDDGRIVEWFGAASDVTARKEAEESLRNLAAELSQADRRKDEFLATLAHELRNPLAPIRTGLEVMKLSMDDPAGLEDVRSTMERQTQQLITLVDDLLDVSRITRGKLELRKCRVELSDVVRSAVEASRPLIEESGHQLAIVMPDDPVAMHADPHRLAQVVSNLLNNAAKYTPEGGHIRLTVETQDRDVVISVEDNGIGIPAEMLDSIFEMFTQVDRPIEKGYTGLGIGLTLVKSLVEMHGGTVTVHSLGPDQGSCFSIRLPVLIEQPDPGSRKTAPAATPKEPGVRVLVVDDNKAAADMLAMVARMLGNEVQTAYDGIEGVAAAADFRPEIILMDLGMPRMNGYEAARQIRDHDWGRDLVLVALTGWGQDEDRKRTKEAGFDHHLVKPAEPADLKQLFSVVNRTAK